MEKMLNRFDYKKLRAGNHLTMLVSVRTLLAGKYSSVTVLPEALRERFLQALAYEEESFHVMRKSKLTNRMEELEYERDTLLRGLVHCVKGFENHFDANKREFARQMAELFRSYGNITEQPHDIETATIADLCAELLAPDMEYLVEALGLTEWVAQLKSINGLYRAQEEMRMEESAEHAKFNLRKARAESDKIFRLILDYLEVQWHTAPSDLVKGFIGDINAITRHFEHLANMSRTKKDDGEGEGGEGDEGIEEIIITE